MKDNNKVDLKSNISKKIIHLIKNMLWYIFMGAIVVASVVAILAIFYFGAEYCYAQIEGHKNYIPAFIGASVIVGIIIAGLNGLFEEMV